MEAITKLLFQVEQKLHVTLSSNVKQNQVLVYFAHRNILRGCYKCKQCSIYLDSIEEQEFHYANSSIFIYHLPIIKSGPFFFFPKNEAELIFFSTYFKFRTYSHTSVVISQVRYQLLFFNTITDIFYQSSCYQRTYSGSTVALSLQDLKSLLSLFVGSYT